MSASDFAAGLRQAYDLGVSGQVAERQLGTYELAGKLPVAARSAAFSRGRAVGQYNATARQAALEARGRQIQGKREGTFHFDRKCRTFDGRRESSLKAMEAISKILTKEAKADNIGVCNVYPGGVDTNFRATANPDYLKPETIAKMIKNCIEIEEGFVHDIVIRPFIEDNMP